MIEENPVGQKRRSIMKKRLVSLLLTLALLVLPVVSAGAA